MAKKKKTRQASPTCHRYPRIDFFPVSWRKWVRNYCLARGSTKLDSLCVCSQQSVSKANADCLWSKHIFIQIGSFFTAVNKTIAHLSKKRRVFTHVQDIYPGVRRRVHPRLFHKVHGRHWRGSYWDENPAAVFPHLLRSRCANNTPARVINEAAGSLKPPAELQSHAAHVRSHNKRKDLSWTWADESWNLLAQRLKMRFLIWGSGKGLLGGGHHWCPPLTVTSLPVEVKRLALLCHFLIKMLTFCWVITWLM